MKSGVWLLIIAMAFTCGLQSSGRAGEPIPAADAGGTGAGLKWKRPTEGAYWNASLPVEDRVKDLLSRMTLEEKIGQLSQGVALEKSIDGNIDEIKKKGYGSFIFSGTDDLSARLQHVALEQTRLGIPLIFGFDAIHGYTTTFPISLGLSCAWEPGLFEKCQAISARETRAHGIQWIFAPMCDLARDPRWGRVAETCGEDPFLASQCVAAEVRGFQGGNRVLPDGAHTACCLKHYVGYGASIGGRDYNGTDIPEFTLRNFHLPAFHEAIKAGALTVMSSFNANDGIPSVADRHTLTEILRDEWGFPGFVVSDWDAVNEQISWGYAADAADAARRALLAGNDMDMISHAYSGTLAEQVKNGTVPIEAIDLAVTRILRVKFELGLFEHPFATAEIEPQIPAASRALARECAARCAVLLKNDGALPLAKKAKKVALIGPLGGNAGEMLGSWPGHGANAVTLAAGLRAKLPAGTELAVIKGCNLTADTAVQGKWLNNGTMFEKHDQGDAVAEGEIDRAVAAAKEADVVIMALGEPAFWSGEDGSRALLTVTGQQQELFDKVIATGKPVIVVLICGRPMVIPEIVDKASAVLVAWQPGIEAGNGIADLLFGDASPSGRLTMSFPVTPAQLPVYYNHYETGRPAQGKYRDFTRNPLFPFGYGLTYTTFQYGEVSIRNDAKTATAEATITNTGAKEGDEVVQLYIRSLSCAEGARPAQELRGFERIKLAPGESRKVQFPLTDEVLGYYGRDGKWRTEVGKYQVWIAPQSGEGTPARYERP